MSEPGRVVWKKQGKIAIITLNSPETSNALDMAAGAELESALTRTSEDSSIKAVILTGNGPNFSAGANVKAIMAEIEDKPDKSSGELLTDLVKPFTRTAHLVTDMEKPVIGAIKGAAAGGGLALALACDIIVAAETARFDPVYLRLGLTPVGGLTYLLPSLMGIKQAAEFLFMAKAVPAREAARLGLVNRVVPDEQVMPTAIEMAETMAEQPGLGLIYSKRLLHEAGRKNLLEAMEKEAQAMMECARHPEHKKLFEMLFKKLS